RRHTRFSRDWSSDVCSSDLKILKDINVALPTHALSAVIGTSGCGKSTLVKSFLRLNEATGECRFAGERIFQTLRIRKIHIRILRSEERRVGTDSRSHWRSEP